MEVRESSTKLEQVQTSRMKLERDLRKHKDAKERSRRLEKVSIGQSSSKDVKRGMRPRRGQGEQRSHRV